jgi:hypothetical protein
MALREYYHEKPQPPLSDHNNQPGDDQLDSPPVERLEPGRRRSSCREAPPGERPSTVGGLVDLIGEDATDELITRFGGRRLYVPHIPQPGDLLSDALGRDAAQRLAEIFGGDRVDVPNPTPRRVLILELRNAGLSVDAIARHLRCTRRRVFQVLAEARSSQGDA